MATIILIISILFCFYGDYLYSKSKKTFILGASFTVGTISLLVVVVCILIIISTPSLSLNDVIKAENKIRIDQYILESLYDNNATEKEELIAAQLSSIAVDISKYKDVIYNYNSAQTCKYIYYTLVEKKR